jgi:DNA-binding protein
MLQPSVKSGWRKLKSGAVCCIIKVTGREVRVMSSEPKFMYVGRKPPMNYVLGIITSFTEPNVKEVMKELSVSKISIGTEEMPPREGENRKRNI